MNPRSTGILLLVAAALGAFVYFYEIRGADTRREAEEREKRLFTGIEPSAIEWIAIRSQEGKEARLERREGRWRLVSPLDFPADAFAADNLASTLATLASESVLEGPGPPEEYGLAEGARVVRFAAGGAEHELRLGKDAPVGDGAYASTGSGAIYTVARYKASSFSKSPDDLRDKRILEFDREAIRRIEASWPGGRVVLEREAAQKPAGAKQPDQEGEAPAPPTPASWRIVEPIAARADAQTIDELLSDLSFLRAEGFVDDPPSDAKAGLAPPAFEIALEAPGEGEGAVPRVVRFAVGAEREGKLRLARGAQHSLYTISSSHLDALPRDLVAYRYKQLASFDVAAAQAIDFFFQSPSADPVVIHAERGESGWTSSPEPFAEGKLDALVNLLSRLRAQGIAADELGERELRGLGLAPPNAIVTVLGKRPEAAKAGEPGAEPPPLPVLAEVQVGNAEGSEWIAARAAGDPTVYRLAYATAEQLPISLDAFRNHFRKAEAPAAGEQKPAPAPGGSEDFLPPSEESP